MIIAKQKKQENTAEYILYMWQIEDMIRACQLDINIIQEKLINEYKVDYEQKKEIFAWYEGLITQMRSEKIETSGHLQFLKNQVNDLNEYHMHLLASEDENGYKTLYETANPNISLFRSKSKDQDSNNIQICLNALYSLLMLRLQKKEINKDTKIAMSSFSNLLGVLSKKYIAFHKGEKEF